MPRQKRSRCVSPTNLKSSKKQSKSTCLSHTRGCPKRTLEGCKKHALPDLKKRLIDCGIYDKYVAWAEDYLNWRKGHEQGATGDAVSFHLESSVWRDGYRKWRQGALKGARGEAGVSVTETLQQLIAKDASVVYDAMADDHGQPMLVPIDGPVVSGMRIEEFPPDALVTFRVFRFFENRRDEKDIWEQELRNVNSGSVLWLPVHLAPGMHSVRGAKYGTWFTIHYLQVHAKHFKSFYHMANDGWSLAKSFGTLNHNRTIQGESLEGGYFWFVSPAAADKNVSEPQHLESVGWKHLTREGPFDGSKFLKEWQKQGSSLTIRDVQVVLQNARCQFDH